jgi:hypothetical protein
MRSKQLQSAYVRLGRRELELDQTDLGLLHAGGSTSTFNDILSEDETIDELSVVDGTANLLDNTNILQINIVSSSGINDLKYGVDSNRSEQ